jgi:O-acetyl-ADP-ribose deacetylase (regulator of RNase III)
MPVKIVTGDIWIYPADVRVNTVNCVGVMGAGIAKAFKARYPAEMFNDYARWCREGMLQPGGIHEWQGPAETILNLATKDHWRQPSTYPWIETGLTNLRWWLDEREKAGKVLKVALPALGCSNGGLSFSLVSSMVNDALSSSGHEVALFHPL